MFKQKQLYQNKKLNKYNLLTQSELCKCQLQQIK